jgi:hypothetical protein
MGGGKVAAGRQGVEQGGDDLPRLILVGDEMQHRDQHQADRLTEVENLAQHRVVQDGGGVAQVSLDVGGAAFW